ncbi:uncharacterized protein LOC121386256 [Gigantopelta aegis]|uniref:uncharacterized protein LOC121386256 n=1 Tax=Gigantopelta aegis TaxID=1735272 RepID=UPI001B88CC10|nr:uncharacterized protein LOC121386256 [Gigantopelta aegis]
MFSIGKLVALSCWSRTQFFMLWKPFLLALVLICDVCLGATVSLDRSYHIGMSDEPFTFTCVIQQAGGLVDTVEFFNSNSDKPIATFQQNSALCYVLITRQDHSSSCGIGTDSNSSTTKKYILKINSITESDQTYWRCGLKRANTFSEYIYQHVLSERVYLEGSYKYAVEDEPFTYTCLIRQAAGLVDTVAFFNGNSAGPVASFEQNGGSCSVLIPEPDEYSASCGPGTDSNLSTYKNYVLKIKSIAGRYETNWWCGLNTAKQFTSNVYLRVYNDYWGVKGRPKVSGLSAGAISGIVIGILLAVAIPRGVHSFTRGKYKRKKQVHRTNKQNGQLKNNKIQSTTLPSPLTSVPIWKAK